MTDQRHELDIEKPLFLKLRRGHPNEFLQALVACASDGHYEAATHSKLAFEGDGYDGATRRYHDGIIGRLVRPAFGSIADNDRHVVAPSARDAFAREIGKFRVSLNRYHLTTEVAHYGRCSPQGFNNGLAVSLPLGSGIRQRRGYA